MALPKNIIISAQAFPPRSGGKQSLMEALAFHAAQTGANVSVFADGKKGDSAYDLAQNKPYKIKRLSPACSTLLGYKELNFNVLKFSVVF